MIAALNLPVWLAAAVDRAGDLGTLAELAKARYPWKVVFSPPHNLVGVYIERIMREHGITRESIVSWGGADLRPTCEPDAEQQAARERSNRDQRDGHAHRQDRPRRR